MKKAYIILVCLCLAVSLIAISPAHGWIDGYEYKKTLTVIQDASVPAYYLIPITVHYGAGSDSNFDVYVNGKTNTTLADVYFTDAYDNHLNSWLFDVSSGSYATYFVPVYGLADANYTIRMYYGNEDDTTYEADTSLFNYSITDLNVIFPMNEGSGTTLNNYGTAGTDATISSASEGAWGATASPYSEPAYWFNQTSGNNHASITDTTDSGFDFSLSYSGFAWTYSEGTQAGTAQIYKKLNCWNTEKLVNNGLQSFFVDSGFSSFGAGYYTTDTADGAYYYLGGSFDDVNNYLDIWRGGSSLVHASKSGNGIYNNNEPVLIGEDWHGYLSFLVLDDSVLNTTQQGWLCNLSYYPQYSPRVANVGALYFRPFVDPEPSSGVWGEEEPAPTPTPTPDPGGDEYATRGEILATAIVASFILIPLLILTIASFRRRK